ncbi:phosphoribosyltransferase [Opitutus terrae]|uniref:Phosphoribosyltransferase n=1 Tax=Opitutus terrae (strain DSM 11246 / JCM 15787 / PB90-1) TaxID=452637 RepID=B1ZU12_OPITP|nr:phosphoribosyltransferase family protein [Opitutus terrae]ACB75894.1 phosphoribosyltransferase [Opitutus terrae PB90-1]
MKTIQETQRYRDRTEAGQLLAPHVRERLGTESAVVLALVRGGVPVACELARQLDAPLDVVIVRKLGAPSLPGRALGAIASDGAEVLDEPLIDQMGLSRFHVAAVADRALAELRRCEELYQLAEPLDLRGRTVVLADDGLATGATMRAAIHAVRARGARRLLVAVPAGDAQSCERIAHEVDAVICPFRPDPFYSVSLWYEDYRPLTDDEVRSQLAAATAIGTAMERHTRM